MAKIQIKSEKLTPFGGIFSIMEKFDSMLSPVIDSTLGQRFCPNKERSIQCELKHVMTCRRIINLHCLSAIYAD